jgi:glycerol-3-phosphate acyltransferase PlsY
VVVSLYFGVVLLAYLVGAIPTGFLIARARGVDIRAAGSGNIGATNVFRVLGRPAGVAVLVLDAAKGAIPCAALPPLALWVAGAGGNPDPEWLGITAGIGAVLGHNYTCWLYFKGGKGIATTAGVLLVLMPVALLTCLVAWLLVFALTRYVSLGSLVASVALPLTVWWRGQSGALLVVALALGLLAIGKHRANIRRLLNGTESRFRWHQAGTSPPPS